MIRRLILALLFAAIPCAAQFPAMDSYGGLTGAPAAGGATGHFRTQRMRGGTGRWAFVDPLGNYFWMNGMYALTYADGGTNYGNAVAAKYASHTQWANFQLGRMQQYGFNAIGVYSATGNYNVYPLQSYGISAASIQMPFLYFLNGADYCTRGTSAATPIYPYNVKNIYNGTNASVYSGGGRLMPDFYDPAFSTCEVDLVAATGDLTHTYGGGFNGGISPSSPWLKGFWLDDTDHLYGSRGFGTGWAGFISTITNPYQASCANCDRNVYSKQQLTTFLQAKYGTGSAGLNALNASWGSTYTSWNSTQFSWSGANEDTALITGNGATSSYSAITMTHPLVTASTLTINVKASPYTQLASDNFTRANENPLSNGGNWTALPGDCNLQVVSDLAESASTGSNCGAYYSGVSPNANQYSAVTVPTLGGTVAVLLRAASSSNHYEIFANNGFSNTSITTSRVVSGTYHQINQVTGINMTAGQVLLAQISGSTITVFVNGVQVDQQTDSSLASGNIGFQIFSSSPGDTTVSNWAGGNYATVADQKVGQDDGAGNLTGTGCVGSPCVTGGTIQYSSGDISNLTFASAVGNNATVNMSYTANAWPKLTTAGTGLLDEDGSSAWFPTQPYPTGGNANLITDMDNFEFAFYDHYFSTAAAAVKGTFPNALTFGPGTFIYNTSPEIFAAEAKDLDVIEVQFGGFQSNSSNVSDTAPCDAAISLGYPCKPQIDYFGIAAQPDSEMTTGWGGPNNEATCGITGGTTNVDYTLQTLRGCAYVQAATRMFNAKASNGVQPVIGFEWWEWVDNTVQGQNSNFGIISSRDNPYGLGLDTNSGTCMETQGAVTITDCSELSSRGDFLTLAIKGNAQLFYGLLGANGGSAVASGVKLSSGVAIQ